MGCESCSHSCGGCSSSSSCGGCGGCGSAELNDLERELLQELAQTPFLPLVQYVRRESYFAPTEPLEPSPVYLVSGTESTGEVEMISLALRRLASRGYLTLDYDIPLSGFDYYLYQTAELKNRLSECNPGYTILPKKGSMALTLRGQEALDDLTFSFAEKRK